MHFAFCALQFIILKNAFIILKNGRLQGRQKDAAQAAQAHGVEGKPLRAVEAKPVEVSDQDQLIVFEVADDAANGGETPPRKMGLQIGEALVSPFLPVVPVPFVVWRNAQEVIELQKHDRLVESNL